jgi:5S rRNA maturation endonuclease (ribonuclease M5)
MDAAEKCRLLAKTLGKLRAETILVEGKRDRRALQELIPGAKIFLAQGKKERLVERLSGCRTVAVLFDFDEEGNRKTQEWRELLSEEGFRVDAESRKRLRAALGITFFEDLDRKKSELETKMEEQKIAFKVI